MVHMIYSTEIKWYLLWQEFYQKCCNIFAITLGRAKYKTGMFWNNFCHQENQIVWVFHFPCIAYLMITIFKLFKSILNKYLNKELCKLVAIYCVSNLFPYMSYWTSAWNTFITIYIVHGLPNFYVLMQRYLEKNDWSLRPSLLCRRS